MKILLSLSHILSSSVSWHFLTSWCSPVFPLQFLVISTRLDILQYLLNFGLCCCVCPAHLKRNFFSYTCLQILNTLKNFISTTPTYMNWVQFETFLTRIDTGWHKSYVTLSVQCVVPYFQVMFVPVSLIMSTNLIRIYDLNNLFFWERRYS